MGESVKALLSLVLIIAGIAAALAWFADRPDAMTWGFRVGAPLVALLALGAILKLQFRRDHAPDYLRALTGTYFNRGGFAFSIDVVEQEGIAFAEAWFQNQHERPCVGRIALRPARGFWLNRSNIEAITYEIECAPGAFGVARLALPLPQELQGKTQKFEVGASAKFPQGRGRRLRFHDGIFLRTDSKFGDGFSTALAAAGAMTGTLYLAKPATITLELPLAVRVLIPNPPPPETRTIWKLGDPPLQPTDRPSP
jgi:hypothetical protein